MGPQEMLFSMYTEPKLGKINPVLGLSSINATRVLLKRESGGEMDRDTCDIIDKTSNQCKICKKNAPSARRFKLTAGSDSAVFNHFVQVDTMFQK